MAEGNKSPLDLSAESARPEQPWHNPKRLHVIFVVLLLALPLTLLLGRCGSEGEGRSPPSVRASALAAVEAISATWNAGEISVDFDVVVTPAVASAESVDYQLERDTTGASAPPLAGTVSFAAGESRKHLHLTLKTQTPAEASLVLVGASRGVANGGERYRVVPVVLSPQPALPPRQALQTPSYKVSASANPAELGRVSGEGVYTKGRVASLRATPLAGSEFVGWSEEGRVLSTSERLQLKVTRDQVLTARFRPRQYGITLSDVTQPEGNRDVGAMTFAVTLSSAAESDLSFDYATSGGSATSGTECGRGVDYIATRGTLTIRKGSKQATIEVAVCGDDEPEEDETFIVTLSSLAPNTVLASPEATGTLANDDPVPSPADTAETRTTLAWLKLDAQGKPLSDQVAAYARTPWSCVLDSTTGLIWEVKSDDGGLHDKEWTYTWYGPDPSRNGGNPGSSGKGYCGETISAGCDTEKFIAAVNAAGWCGASDWRLPTQEELQSLVDLAHSSPAVDSTVFPNMRPSWYWSSSPVASDIHHAWLIGFYYGYDVWGHKSHDFYVRLVRSGR